MTLTGQVQCQAENRNALFIAGTAECLAAARYEVATNAGTEEVYVCGRHLAQAIELLVAAGKDPVLVWGYG